MSVAAHIDIEVLPNYFLVGISDATGRKYVYFEQHDSQALDVERLIAMLTHEGLEFYSFNGANYDLPLVRFACMGKTCAELKATSDWLISGNLKGWQVERELNLIEMRINHVDLIEVAPGMNGLKTYGGRLHARKLQDMPLPHDQPIEPEQRALVRRYNRNDLDLTRELRLALAGQVELRKALMQQMRDELREAGYGLTYRVDDLRSKSDAQIAESVLRQRVLITTGTMPRKLDETPQPFRYVPPKYIQFRTKALRDVLDTVRAVTFNIKPTGHVEMPDEIANLDIEIDGTRYKLGIGGLHSQESEVSHFTGDGMLLKDIDVTSYYPNLMLNMGMYPKALGPAFLSAYRGILDERVTAKRAGDKVKDAVLKITLNGTFGKTSSRYSILYNPKMMLYTTLTGQLSMLMLIELFHRGGIRVVSANTDGIVVHYHESKEELRRKLVDGWQRLTNLSTEETDYVSIHSRDVNSYFAIKPDGSIKRKGAYATLTLAKSPNAEVCADAVAEFLTTGTPVADHIRKCQDLRKFIVLRRVTGGAVKDGEMIGKVIRWYYSTRVKGTINYAEGGKIVGSSVGARPVMELPETFPDDVDFEWYIEQANEILCDIGMRERPPKAKLPRRGTKAWKALEQDGMVEVDEYGRPAWAVKYENIPDEYKMFATERGGAQPHSRPHADES